jgi:hypothetical protein
MADRIAAIRGLMGGNPDAFVAQALQSNPQFAEFVQRNQGKSVEQVLSENMPGIRR